MKKILFALVVTLMAFAASAQKSASVTAKALETGKSSGKYVMTLSSDITSAKVDEVKGYYTDYFTVSYDQVKHEATIALTANEPMNKRVILRFLSSLGMRTVNVDGSEKTLEDFYDGYLK